MRVATFVWATAFLALGALLAAGVVGSVWPTGSRIGAASLLLTVGTLTWTVPAVAWASRRRSDEGTGVCPVGAACACGHFNFKPKPACKACGAPTRYG